MEQLFFLICYSIYHLFVVIHTENMKKEDPTIFSDARHPRTLVNQVIC